MPSQTVAISMSDSKLSKCSAHTSGDCHHLSHVWKFAFSSFDAFNSSLFIRQLLGKFMNESVFNVSCSRRTDCFAFRIFEIESLQMKESG